VVVAAAADGRPRPRHRHDPVTRVESSRQPGPDRRSDRPDGRRARDGRDGRVRSDGPPPQPDTDADVQDVLDALSDADCRRILADLDEPRTATEVSERCDLPRTSTYRKLSALSEAELVDEEVEVRADGNHATRYVRHVSGVLVAYDGESSFSMDVVADASDVDSAPGRAGVHTTSAGDDAENENDEDGSNVDAGCRVDPETDDDEAGTDAESPDERLARYWSRISEEL
jgi:DNA-binding transcriptional ArsR family regulator